MTTGHWQRLEELFTQALERPASERAAFLAQAASGDETLRGELEKLLATHGQASGFLEPDSPQRSQVLQSIEESLLIGSTLGPYRIEELLGGGGMGIVYRAHDTRQDRDVAIKVLRREALADPAARKRFAQECRAAAALDHPCIVRVYGADQQDGVDFLVMEFVSGRTLRDSIASGPVAYHDAVHYACQVADALVAAHAKGVTHRDIKPANIMITPDGGVKVLDFGLCQWSANPAEGASSTHTQAGMLLGTAAYMSPEQAQGLPADARSDIFSFGALFYEMLTARQAFSEPTTIATLAAILYRKPRFDSGIPAEAQLVLARCLEKIPEQRFQTASALHAALDRVDRALGGGRLSRAALRARSAIWNKRSKGLRWALAVAALSAIVWLGSGVFRRMARAPTQAILSPDFALSLDPAVSRDGTLLAYASDRAGEGTLDIWLQPLPKGNAVRLVHAGFDAREPSFSPDGKRVAFHLDRGAGEINAAPISGGPLQSIAPLGRLPRFSPDGKWIAYWVGPEGSSDMFSPGVSSVYVVPSSGGAPRRIAPELPAASHPVWTPDSSAVLIPAPANKEPGLQGIAIWVAPVNGGPARQAISPSRFREWKIAGQPASLRLFYLYGFPVGVSRSGGLLIPTPIGSHMEIWEFPLAPRTWISTGAPKQVTTLFGSAAFPAFGADGAVFYGDATRKASLSALPIEFPGGKPSGPPRELASCPEAFCLPYLSRDGSKVLFTGFRDKGWNLYVKDLQNGQETTLARGGVGPFAALTADGRYAFYSEESEEKVNLPSRLYRVSTAGGPPEVVCEACPRLWDVSTDGRYILGGDSKPRQVVLVDLRVGARSGLLRHPSWSLYRARFSPDGKWVAFTARGGSQGTRILVAPFHPGREQPPADWITITPGDSQDGPVAWSPQGDALYFTSERDGYRCIWVQGLEAATKRPLGAPQPLQHFHDARLSLKNITSSWFTFSVARDKIVYELGERTGKIWATR